MDFKWLKSTASLTAAAASINSPNEVALGQHERFVYCCSSCASQTSKSGEASRVVWQIPAVPAALNVLSVLNRWRRGKMQG
jgi:hypothetical protein